MKKLVCTIAAAMSFTMTAFFVTAVSVSAFEVMYDENGSHYIMEDGDIYKPAFDDDGFAGHYLDKDGNKSYTDDNGFMYTLLPYPNDGSHPEMMYGSYDGYELTIPKAEFSPYYTGWSCRNTDGKNIRNSHYSLYWEGTKYFYDYSGAVIRIPSRIRYEIKESLVGTDRRTRTKYTKGQAEVVSVTGSCSFKGFDLDPENEYMKCVDNVIFSRDGTRLMSYAQYDERREYTIPEGTQTVGESAFDKCFNLEKVVMADTVSEIEDNAFYCMNARTYVLSDNVEVIPEHCFYGNPELRELYISPESKLNVIESCGLAECPALEELWLPSFEISVDKEAFGLLPVRETPVKLKSYVQPAVHNEGNMLKWDKIPGASYYEIYQRLGNGEYKLLSTTKGTSCKLPVLGEGKKYTFAVKPMAVIPAANYDKEKDGDYPEYFTIEGTISKDITAEG